MTASHRLLGAMGSKSRTSACLFVAALLMGAPPAARAKDLQTKLAESFYLRLPHALEVASKTGHGGSLPRWREQVPSESSKPSPGVRLTALPGPFQSTGHCSSTVHIGFVAGKDTLYITQGRSPQECNAAPRLIWTANGVSRSDPLPPLYDFNVSAMWLTKTYVVFGLEADYEGGSHAERFAFWNLDTGAMSLTLPAHWDREQASRHARLAVFAGLTDWRDATVQQAEKSIVIVQGGECAEAWPETREYARCAP